MHCSDKEANSLLGTLLSILFHAKQRFPSTPLILLTPYLKVLESVSSLLPEGQHSSRVIRSICKRPEISQTPAGHRRWRTYSYCRSKVPGICEAPTPGLDQGGWPLLGTLHLTY